ncbi:hypothetical protein Barb6_03322 [Bacteroidales bacterium Barb6]|nr:hypothetical protein Barb6_03322 [Bacteroidales bacterium Barb6]OAV69966.1 hypothetical protein Barb6XT_00168 [Bacteroidales bacterium Barb6XT]
MEQSAGVEYENEKTIGTTNSLRSAWYKLRERLEDLYDLLHIWWYRNEPTMPAHEFFEEIERKRGIDNV